MKIDVTKIEVFMDKKVQIASYEPVSLKLGYTAEVSESESIEEINSATEKLIYEVKRIVNKEVEQIIEEELKRVKTDVNVGATDSVSVKVNGETYQPPQKQQAPLAPPKKNNTVNVTWNGVSYPLTVTPDHKDMTCPVCGGKLYLNTRKSDGHQFFGCGNWKTSGCKFSANLEDIEKLQKQQAQYSIPEDDSDLPYDDLPVSVPYNPYADNSDDTIPF